MKNTYGDTMAIPVKLVMNKTVPTCPTCIICSTPSNLRLLCSKGVQPQCSPVLQEVKQIFDIDLLTVSNKDKIATWRICIGCKNRISKSAQLKAKLMSLGNKLGRCWSSEPKEKQMSLKRAPQFGQLESESAVIPEKKTKVMSGGSPERNTQKSAGSNNDHDYCQCNPEKSTQELAASSLDHEYGPLSSPKERAEASVKELKKNIYIPQTDVISPEVKTKLSSVLSQTNVYLGSVVDCIFNSSQLMAALQRRMLLKIDGTCQSLASLTIQPGPSVLRTLQNPQCLKPEDLMAKTYLELKTTLPFVHDLFNAIAGTMFSCKSDTASYVSHVAMMYALGMHCRNKDLCTVQKFLTYIALKFNANDELLEFFNKCGVTLAAESGRMFAGHKS